MWNEKEAEVGMKWSGWIIGIAVGLVGLSCRQPIEEVVQVRSLPSPADLERQCEEQAAEPQVEQLAPGLFIARGFDLATTVLIQTEAGNVIVDTGMSPTRARPMRDALLEQAPGPIAAIIYTHSHMDHIGGASVWAEEDTQIWSTEAFYPHLMKQYGSFREAETRRAARQWGLHVDEGALSCSAIGRRIDLRAALDVGILKPTHTFSGSHTLSIGGVDLELVEAHGETHDQLFVWIESMGALLSGDNYYAAFPNLYTIRGTSPRPVDQWIASLDAMRRKDPELLVPAHTAPLKGKQEIRAVLTDYRDAIQWTRDAVVRAANKEEDVDSMVASIGLPLHLADKPYLKEMYGQLDWAVRAIYGNQMGWFDGRADRLYTPTDASAREIGLMGGPDAVLAAAQEALDAGDGPWAAHLLAKLQASGLMELSEYSAQLAQAYEMVGVAQSNTNGRAYLLESAHELRVGREELPKPVVNDQFLMAIPLEVLFENLAVRLYPERAMDVHESVVFVFPDEQVEYVVTVRRGVAEVIEGSPLPETPAPVARVQTDADTWRKLALGKETPIAALSSGRMKVDGLMKFRAFMGRFRRGL